MVQSWGQLDAAKAQIEATTAQVNAAEIALNGVREEARVGQRTTLDVLNAQQELVNARVALVTAQHDRVVASYTLLAAVGGLSMQRLGLNVMVYDPQVQVRDAWIGVRTPDAGRQARRICGGFLIAAVRLGLRDDRAGGNVAECGLCDSPKRSERFAPHDAATVS